MVDWRTAGVLVLGSIAGGNAGAKFNLSADKRLIRWILTAVVFISSIKILFDTFS